MKDKYNYNIFLLSIYGKENNIRHIHVDIKMDEKMFGVKNVEIFYMHESLFGGGYEISKYFL